MGLKTCGAHNSTIPRALCILGPMKKAIKGLLSSKKALMAFISAAVWIGGKVGLDLDAAELLPAVSPMWLYIFAQGATDFKKEAAKIEKGDSAS